MEGLYGTLAANARPTTASYNLDHQGLLQVRPGVCFMFVDALPVCQQQLCRAYGASCSPGRQACPLHFCKPLRATPHCGGTVA